MIRLERFAQPSRLNRRQAMMHVVKQVHVGADFAPQPFEELRDGG